MIAYCFVFGSSTVLRDIYHGIGSRVYVVDSEEEMEEEDVR